jgi:hypothetical protein
MGQTLRVQVVHDDIVVTLPGYRYSAAYYKAEGSPGLVVRYSPVQSDLRRCRAVALAMNSVSSWQDWTPW